MRNALVFFIAGLASFLLERTTKSGCKETAATIAISLLHNYGSIFLFFGSALFGYHRLHLLCLSVVVALWYLTKNNMCFVTVYYNNLCNISPTRPFHDVFYVLNQRVQIPYFREMSALLAALYDVHHIAR